MNREWQKKEIELQELRADLARTKHAAASTKQWIIWVATTVVVVMGVFPPWLVTYPRGITRSVGYAPIFSPPQPQFGGIRLDVVRLIVQWVTMLFLAVGLAWTMKENSAPSEALARTIRRLPELLRRFFAAMLILIGCVLLDGMVAVLNSRPLFGL